MITLNNVTVILGKNRILDDLSLDIESGEFVIICGKSGSGKTTLLNTIGMLVNIKSGEIFYDGNSYTGKSSTKKLNFINNNIGFIFQDYFVVEQNTIYQNLEFCCKSRRKKDKVLEINEVLDKVGVNLPLDRKIENISGGEKQRVSIARVLLRDCSIILADEPTGSLDEENAKKVIELFTDLNKAGKTIVMVSHDMNLLKYATRVISI